MQQSLTVVVLVSVTDEAAQHYNIVIVTYLFSFEYAIFRFQCIKR